MARLNITLTRFFGLSLAIHAAVFCYFILMQKLAWKTRAEPPAIPVSLLPPGEKDSAAPAPPAATKIAKPPAPSPKRIHRSPTGKNCGCKPTEPERAPAATTAEKTAVAIEKTPLAERNRDEQVAGLPVADIG